MNLFAECWFNCTRVRRNNRCYAKWCWHHN